MLDFNQNGKYNIINQYGEKEAAHGKDNAGTVGGETLEGVL